MLCLNLLFALSDESKDPNTNYYKTLNKNRAYYKAHREKDKAIEKAKDAKNEAKRRQIQLLKKSYPSFEDIDIKKQINKSYYKVLIKQRSKLRPDEYKYTKIRSSKDLKKAGVEIKKKSKRKKILNYVEIKHLYQSPFKKEKEKNIGVIVDKKAKSPKEILNIVDIENSSLNGKINSGVDIRKSKFRGEIKNSVEIRNSKIGDLE